MAMQFSTYSKHLIVITMIVIAITVQVTECKYSVPVLRYYRSVTRCSLCPHALFLQARSQLQDKS